VTGAATGVTLAGIAAADPSVAGARPFLTTSYVSPSGTEVGANTSCATAGFTSIQTAVDDTAPGGTVIVCKGTYTESVTISQLLTLQGRAGAVVDATGQPYAIGLAHSHDTVTGMTVENATVNTTTQAPGDGIITAGLVSGTPIASNGDVIVHNIAKNNQGSGIDLNSTTNSIATRNVTEGNGVGINLSNDLGKPASHNRVAGNITSHNPGGCGIALADHTGTGVFDNVIIGNVANDNGLGTPSRPNASSGSGVIFAAAGPTGGVYDNTVISNRMSGNGHGGVALHAHVKGAKFSGNRVIDNVLGKNNVRTDYKDTHSTGMYFGDAGSVTITVRGNVFRHDHMGVFTAGHVTLKHSSNTFVKIPQHFVHIAKYAG
jgi:nitrous oxidase accessory protein NosD